MPDASVMLNKLSKSKFRSSFHLRKYMISYIQKNGLEKIEEHARDLIIKKIGVMPLNDGKQTPLKAHPVFIAMHATGCCCRKCLFKWYGIKTDRPLTNDEVNFLVKIVMMWIKIEYNEKINMWRFSISIF